MKLKALSLFLLATVATSSSSAFASQISLSTSTVYFDSNKQEKKTVQVINVDVNTTTYFDVKINEVKNLGQMNDEYLEVVTNPEIGGLIATPSKSILREGEKSRAISIINLNTSLDKERAYRVDVTPIISGVDLKQEDIKGVKMLLGYDVLVYVQPDNPTFAHQARIENDRLYISNLGNSHFNVGNIEACDKEDKCTSFDGGSIFSDLESSISIPKGTVRVTFSKFMRGKDREKVIVSKD